MRFYLKVTILQVNYAYFNLDAFGKDLLIKNVRNNATAVIPVATIKESIMPCIVACCAIFPYIVDTANICPELEGSP